MIPRPLILLCAAICLTTAVVQGDDESVSAPLQRLAPSPKFLEAPAGLTGDFSIAKEAPEIDFRVYPQQPLDGAKLWSCWGEVVCGSDDKFYAAFGDHGAPHGRTYLYVVDPVGRWMGSRVDYNKVVGIPANKYAPGKIHGGLVEMKGDRGIYFAGYDGGLSQTTREYGFAGNWLLRHDLDTHQTKNLGIVVPDISVITLKGFAPTHSLYGLAIPGRAAANQKWSFFHYDLKPGKLRFSGGPEPDGARALIVTPNGIAYYGHRDPKSQRGVLVKYDPESHDTTTLAVTIPGDGVLRAASRTDASGVAYCFSKDGVLFAFDTRQEKVTELTKAFVAEPLYTTACILDPTDRYLYYVPGAHGGARKIGTPVLRYDIATHQRTVVCFLNAALREQKKYSLGGTYGLALSADGNDLFISWNGAAVRTRYEDFGECAAMVLHLPQKARK